MEGRRGGSRGEGSWPVLPELLLETECRGVKRGEKTTVGNIPYLLKFQTLATGCLAGSFGLCPPIYKNDF